MPICQDCLSRNLIKFGKYNSQQKWHCINCGLTSIYVRKRMPKKELRKVIRGYRNPKTKNINCISDKEKSDEPAT